MSNKLQFVEALQERYSCGELQQTEVCWTKEKIVKSSELKKVLEYVAADAEVKKLPIAERRVKDDENGLKFRLPEGTEIEEVETENFKGEWVRTPDVRKDAAMLYLHGGAYVFCSPRSHRHLVAGLSAATNLPAFALDYRLAPEAPFPAAIDDVVSAYHWLLAQGFSPDKIIVAGDSAGGGLTLALMISLREAELPLPAAGVLICPWVDLTLAGASYSATPEAQATWERLVKLVRLYLHGAEVKNPLASPLYADLSGLSPLLIHGGTADPFFSDSVSLEPIAKAAGIDVTLEVWEDMVHIWHYYHPMLSEGREAIAKIGEFVKAKI